MKITAIARITNVLSTPIYAMEVETNGGHDTISIDENMFSVLCKWFIHKEEQTNKKVEWFYDSPRRDKISLK